MAATAAEGPSSLSAFKLQSITYGLFALSLIQYFSNYGNCQPAMGVSTPKNTTDATPIG